MPDQKPIDWVEVSKRVLAKEHVNIAPTKMRAEVEWAVGESQKEMAAKFKKLETTDPKKYQEELKAGHVVSVTDPNKYKDNLTHTMASPGYEGNIKAIDVAYEKHLHGLSGAAKAAAPNLHPPAPATGTPPAQPGPHPRTPVTPQQR
jgi:hypothetical protein